MTDVQYKVPPPAERDFHNAREPLWQGGEPPKTQLHVRLAEEVSAILAEEEVSAILAAAAAVSEKKRQDYAGQDPDSNFSGSSEFARDLCRDIPVGDRRWATAVLIGVKLERLRTLGLAGVANNESVDDTLGDLINYVAILLRQQKRARRES